MIWISLVCVPTSTDIFQNSISLNVLNRAFLYNTVITLGFSGKTVKYITRKRYFDKKIFRKMKNKKKQKYKEKRYNILKRKIIIFNSLPVFVTEIWSHFHLFSSVPQQILRVVFLELYIFSLFFMKKRGPWSFWHYDVVYTREETRREAESLAGTESSCQFKL